MHDRLAAEKGSTGEAKEKRAEEAAPLKPVFVHGWVYDLESGTVTDLNVSTGPKGFEDFVPSDVTKPSEEESKGNGEEEAKKTESEEASKTESEKGETPTATKESAAETSTPTEEKSEQELVNSVDVKEVGRHTIPVRRSNMLARLRRSMSQQGSSSGRFSRQI